MGWHPYLVGTRLTAELRAPNAFARAKELIAMRGPVLDLERPDQLEFVTPGLLFIFINPFALVSRTVVRIDRTGGRERLIYDLKHPIDILLIVALGGLLLDGGVTLLPGVTMFLLYALLHSGMLYFMHRDLVRKIGGAGADRGAGLLQRSRQRT